MVSSSERSQVAVGMFEHALLLLLFVLHAQEKDELLVGLPCAESLNHCTRQVRLPAGQMLYLPGC